MNLFYFYQDMLGYVAALILQEAIRKSFIFSLATDSREIVRTALRNRRLNTTRCCGMVPVLCCAVLSCLTRE